SLRGISFRFAGANSDTVGINPKTHFAARRIALLLGCGKDEGNTGGEDMVFEMIAEIGHLLDPGRKLIFLEDAAGQNFNILGPDHKTNCLTGVERSSQFLFQHDASAKAHNIEPTARMVSVEFSLKRNGTTEKLGNKGSAGSFINFCWSSHLLKPATVNHGN